MSEKGINELYRLSKIVTANKLKQLSFPLKEDQKTNLHELYRLVSAGKLTTTKEVEEFFFKELNQKEIYTTRLQRRLREALLDALFLIDATESGFSPLQKAYYQCYRNMTAVKILLGKSERAAAIPIAERTIQKAIKYELVGVVVELARDLRTHYGGISGQLNKWKIYNRLVEEWTEKYLVESRVEGYYSDIMTNFTLSKSNKKELARVVDGYLANVESRVIAIGSFRASWLYYLLKALRFEIVNDFANMLKISEEALTYFGTKKELVTVSTWYTFNQNLLIANIRLRRPHFAEAKAKKCIQLATPGSFSWYNAHYFYIILCFHANQFDKSFGLWQTALENKGFGQMPDTQKETWLIIEAAMHFFILTGKVVLPAGQTLTSNFRLNKFLNEVPAFSKDKRGNNINILILHILFLIQGKRYNEIHDRVESLRVYASRYLRKDDTFRSNCFIRLLMCLPSGHFHKAAVLRKAKPFLDKLQSVPYEKADQPIEIEIIPYETLWNIVYEMLDHKIH